MLPAMGPWFPSALNPTAALCFRSEKTGETLDFCGCCTAPRGLPVATPRSSTLDAAAVPFSSWGHPAGWKKQTANDLRVSTAAVV